MKYYIVGYMYSGKTTFGRRLAAQKGMDFLDLDRAFEQRYHYTVPRFFDRFGEEAFRRLETQMLLATAGMDNVVVATGGGTPCHSGNMDFILAHGTAVYLRMTADELLQRALRSRNPRPLARGLSADELRADIGIRLPAREAHYLRAQVVVEAGALLPGGPLPDLFLG